MIRHDFAQGSPEWHAHRANHFNASDAPAMLGLSPYKTRSELVREFATGITADVDAATQRLFDEGHRTERLARPIAEQIIGRSLYPITGSDGDLSASFDGLDAMESTAFECKRLNARLREAMVEGCTGADLPMDYQVQMEQQCMVSRCERVLFVAAEFDDDDHLVEERHCWYTPNPELAERIRAGWAQFAADVAAYVPTHAEPAAVAAPVESLPAVFVQTAGSLVVSSNLETFGEALRGFIAKMPERPGTDQEFADTEAACKALKRAEEALDAAESKALSQLADVEVMRRLVADFKALARTTRLQREKLVEARKAEIKAEIVAEARASLCAHVAELNGHFPAAYLAAPVADFAGAIKGKKSVASIREAVGVTLANAKADATRAAAVISANLTRLTSGPADLSYLFPDFAAVCTKSADDFEAQVQLRIAKHEAAQAAAAREAQAQAEAKAAEDARKAALVGEVAQSVAAAPAVATFGQMSVVSPQFAAALREPFIVTNDEDDEALAECLTLLDHIGKAFAGRFQAHPKPNQEWWTELRRLADACGPKVRAAHGIEAAA